jgi:alpha-mannosidase
LHHTCLTESKIARRLELVETLVYRRDQPLSPFRLHAGDEPLVAPDVDDGDWPVIEPGTCWGKLHQGFTLRTTFVMPAGWRPPVALFLPIGNARQFVHPEALACVDGVAWQGVNAYHQEVLLPPRWCDGNPHVLALHGWFGIGNEPVLMGQPEIVQIHQPTRDFVAAARVALGVLRELDENDPVHGHLLNALDEAFRQLDLREPFDCAQDKPFGDGFYNSVTAAQQTLDEGLAAAGPPLAVDIIAVGHAHLDVAWLWPTSQTRRKAARTFSSVLRLMEQFPDFHFTQSQPQLYRYVAEDHPDIFERVRARVAEGRWEVTGGTWVQADCNVTGAESLVRQFLLGRRFFRQHFGDAETPILWLPDTFGFPWTLPQLIKQAGLKYFMTTKLSWNQYNRLPYDSFWWQGLDGTRILTHFITTPDTAGNWYNTYNGDLTPRQVIGTWRNYQQKGTHAELLTAFGWGDGGGGPTREMLENGRRLANHPGAPRVRLGSASEFFQNLEVRAGGRLPVWNGELYLEYHRGTYTSQAHTKRANRKCEFLLHDAEFLAAWAALATGYEYPHAELTRAWELLCLNQFHDVLPGSSIGQVYEDSACDYEAIRAIGEQVRETALAALARLLPETAAFVAVNPTSFGGRHIGLLPERLAEGQTLTDLASGEPLVIQPVEDGTLVEVVHVEPYGLVALGSGDTPPPPPAGMLVAHLINGVAVLENDALCVEFDMAGDIIRLFDKTVGREVLPPGRRANVFRAFEDRPLGEEDAWNIDIFYDDKQWAAEPAHSLMMIEQGPLRAGLEIRRRILNSEIVQRVYLHRDSHCLDFDTWVDWREHHVLFKVAFPVDVLSPVATYDIQWGNIQRPTHRNTSWDWARFETCAHKWVDLSEGDYGVSLLNDCKYGYDVQGDVVRLTLLRSPTYPDPNADKGEHRFTYSLLPHRGDWRMGTVPTAYMLNDPLIVRRVNSGGPSPPGLGRTEGGRGSPSQSLVAVGVPNVIIETVKQAENGRGLVVRLYENERSRGSATLRTGFPLASAYRCNLLEEDETPLAVTQNAVHFSVKPYQIVTLRLVPASGK